MKLLESDLALLRPKKGLWRLLPFADGTAWAVNKHIYIDDTTYKMAHTEPTIFFQSQMVHEKMHLARQAELGWQKWIAVYLLSETFRMEEEFIAIEPQFEFLHQHGESLPVHPFAKNLASGLYLYAISEEKALDRLYEIANRVYKKSATSG